MRSAILLLHETPSLSERGLYFAIAAPLAAMCSYLKHWRWSVFWKKWIKERPQHNEIAIHTYPFISLDTFISNFFFCQTERSQDFIGSHANTSPQSQHKMPFAKFVA